ncbi:hypothetical protein OG456_04855 [Streptomyces sp. NBC_01446]|nr:hypothetical protein [Streptomyces sp. NBC_01446]MCX4641787.1 hypothetical protein [Streptomyces sp. NBC_01446]
MAFVEDECPVEEFAVKGAVEPFAVCVRFWGLGPAFEGALAAVGELAAAVTDQELDA